MLRRRVREFRPPRRAASSRPLLQAAALLAAVGVGFSSPRGLPSTRARRRPRRPRRTRRRPGGSKTASAGPDLAASPRFANVSYRPADADGRVGIEFDVTTRQTIIGRPEEPEVAQLLAYLRLAQRRDRRREVARDRSRLGALRRRKRARIARDRRRAFGDAAQGLQPRRAQEGRRRARHVRDDARDPDRLPRSARGRQEPRRCGSSPSTRSPPRPSSRPTPRRSSRCARRRSIRRRTASCAPRRRPR